MRLIFLIALMIASAAGADDHIIVTTENGQIRGRTQFNNGTNVLQFISIPYSKPPVGNLRFQKPTRHANWTGIRDATTYGPSCIQALLENDAWLLPNTNVSEDCLYLNIYVPRDMSRTNLKAVMVWIHGGGFNHGQGMLVDGSYLAIEGDVIVVTINYRLGIFGFISTDDSNAPGNYGLWDQRFAIHWVKRNIQRFGGDPGTITIFGESAGGYSVGLLSVSPRNKGLFQRAISESGTVYSPKALSKYSRTSALNLGKLLNCSTESSAELVACLRQLPSDDLQNTVQNNELYTSEAEMTFEKYMGPVVDGDLIVVDPVQTLLDTTSKSYETFTSIDVMAGTNNAEGGLLYFSLMGYQQKYNFNISVGIPKKVLCDLVAPAVAHDYYESNADVSKAICEFYGSFDSTPGDLSRSIVNIYADLQFIVPTVRTLMLHSNTDQPAKRNYHYIFTHQPSYPWIQTRPTWLQGANHAGELPFVFGLDAMYKPDVPKPLPERELSRQMMIYWTNFAKTGNPNYPRKPEVHWSSYNDTNKYYMNLTMPPSLSHDLFADRIKLWTETIPGIISRTSDASQTVGSLLVPVIVTCLYTIVLKFTTISQCN